MKTPADQPRPRPPEVVLWRFSLRRMLLYVAIVCCMLAALNASGGLGAMVLTVAFLVVAAHVFGTAVGTRLRDGATNHLRWRRRHDPHAVDSEERLLASARREPVQHNELPVEKQLSGREPAISRLFWILLAGAVVGATIGGLVITLVLWGRVTWGGVVVGAFSAGVLGGWLTLLGSCFYGITRRTWRDAVAQHESDSRRVV